MDKIMKPKLLRLIIAALLSVIAVWVALNSHSAMVYGLRLWHGNNINWNGIEVELNDREYFSRFDHSSENLFIGDWKSQDATIVLHAGKRTSAHQRVFVSDFCAPKECRHVSEFSTVVNGEKVDIFTFVKMYGGPSRTIFHQYILIDGADIWIEYFGEESRYASHKSTIDSLIEKITKK